MTPPPQGEPPLTSGTVAVNQTTALLTAIGQSRQLTATTRNEAGTTVNAAVTWRSSAPDQVSVDATGLVTARAIGSAQIFAESGGVRSAPIFIVVAEPAPGALIVSDAQVLAVGPPLGLAPGDVPGIGTRYEVRISGIASPPSPGTVVLASGNAPVAGKVVATRTESGATVVTLAAAPLRELLTRYHINWSIDLAAFPAVLDLTNGGSAVASPRAAQTHPATSSPAANIIQPFSALSCDASLGPVLIDRKVQMAPTANLQLDVIETPGHTRRALVGQLKTVGNASIKLNAGFKISGNCLAQVLIRIPIGGPLALGIMPGVRIGVGVGVDGQFGVTAGELSVVGEVGTQLEIGWECGGAAPNCRALQDLTRINSLKPKFEVFNPVTGMRVELSGQFYALVGLDAVLFTSFTIPLVEAKVGPVQSVDLGFEDDQALNPGYASKYDLKIEAVVQPGSGLQNMLDFTFGSGHVTFQGKYSALISESPKGTLTASRSVVGLTAQPVDFRVDLSKTDYFLIGYNVVRVELWQRRSTESTFKRIHAFNVTASNQTIFTYTWQPTPDDLGVNDFAAFVYTQFPVPGLEIADNSVAKVDVKCFSTPRVVGTVAAANTCADEWVGTARFFSPGLIQIDASVTWRRNPAIPEIAGDISYEAFGTATVKWIDFENKGCSVSRTVFPINSDEVNDNSDLLVHYGAQPPFYVGGAEILLRAIATCPGQMPFEIVPVMVWFGGTGELTLNGTAIIGRHDAGGGTYWEWRFVRP